MSNKRFEMKIIVFFMFLSFSVFADNNYPSPEKVDQVTKTAIEQAISPFLKTISEQLKTSSPKYVQGASISFLVKRKMVIHYLEIDGQVDTLNDDFTLRSMDLLSQSYYDNFHRPLFVPYNMKEGQPYEMISDDNKRVIFTSGLIAGGVNSDMDVFENSVDYSFDAEVTIEDDETGADIIKIDETITVTLKTEVYFRPDTYKLSGTISVKDRELKGAQIRYRRRGPFPNQKLATRTDIEGNKFSFDKVIPGGEYDITLKHAFCGCSAVVEKDKVFNPKFSQEHNFTPLTAVNTLIHGRIINQKYEPIKYRTIQLVPRCSEADKVMHEVENAVTDEDGYYYFKEVPKGFRWSCN